MVVVAGISCTEQSTPHYRTLKRKENASISSEPLSAQPLSPQLTMDSADRPEAFTNRLIREKSPYLLQHAHNPVDWYPWSDEAFAKARQEQKPIFLSIGYSTCHWCHVMERESFENPEIAALLNQWFVSIKVDREEHPDLDQVYMSAVMMMTGQGGWPLTAFLTPDLKPFFGGTYFPPERRRQVAGMNEVLPAVAQAWEGRRDELLTSAERLTSSLSEQLGSRVQSGAISDKLLVEAFNDAVGAFDASWGGFGSAPKFPRSHELSFLLRYWTRTKAAQALEMVTVTLDRMAHGGIHDHLGGGFHRYATDERWLVPHFEKMLYDQALLARTYLEAFRATKRVPDAEVARDILDYVLRDMTDAQGGFYSAEDADSEGEEGKFYVWTPEEIVRTLGEEEGVLFNRFYGVSAEGNFSAEGGSASPVRPQQSEPGRAGGEHETSILHIEQPIELFAKREGLEPSALAQRLRASREKLLAVRSRRVRPHRDEKILTSWNGLMIAALAEAGSTLDESRYTAAATNAAEFVLSKLATPDGGLLRRYRDGEALYPGTLEDYAFFIDGIFALYESTFDPRWLAHAKRLAARMVDEFWDEQGGGFFLRSRHEPPLIVRSKEFFDSATPSGNSMAVLALLRLGRLLPHQPFEDLGRRALDGWASVLERSPMSAPQMFIAVDFALGPTTEVVIAGDPAAASTARMVRALQERFVPRAVSALHPPGSAGQAIEALAPYVKGQEAVRDEATAYVCERFICQLPTTDLAQFIRQLEHDISGTERR